MLHHSISMEKVLWGDLWTFIPLSCHFSMRWEIGCGVQFPIYWCSCLQKSSSGPNLAGGEPLGLTQPTSLLLLPFSRLSWPRAHLHFAKFSDFAALWTVLFNSSPSFVPLLWGLQQPHLFFSSKSSCSSILFSLQRASQTFTTWTTHHWLPIKH